MCVTGSPVDVSLNVLCMTRTVAATGPFVVAPGSVVAPVAGVQPLPKFR